MLERLVITSPTPDRVSVGKAVKKDNQLIIVLQVQDKDGGRLPPLNEVLRIPIHLPFNEPVLNFHAEYRLLDRNTEQVICVGDGETCKRKFEDGIKSLSCRSPNACPLANASTCKPYGRLKVLIGDDDPLNSFALRITDLHVIRTLAARLQYFQAISGDRLACLPLELLLRRRGKSTWKSSSTSIFHADITVRSGMCLEDTLREAKRVDEVRQSTGFNQRALDNAARQKRTNGDLVDDQEDSDTILNLFFPKPKT